MIDFLKFVQVMAEKLEENSHKGGWLNDPDFHFYLSRMEEEVTEVSRSILNRESVLDVRRECADVANFAMMVADSYEAFLGKQANPRRVLAAKGAKK